ncbi:MAG TPA: sodium:proton antiporter [Bacteroidetes bacterium]|nr:sodium:proton antiporter [Bacteroidota bacterium]
MTVTTIILIVFVLGYLGIAFEHPLRINKAATALITGVLCWTIYIMGEQNSHHVLEDLGEHLDEIAQILFFLIGAMTIVELVDIHGGFEVITKRIKTRNKVKLIWTIALITFFLSAALDNLTTSIVMVSLLSKIIDSRKDRLLFAGVVVIAANSGGAWSPIGDVTTTMLWIDNKITAPTVIANLIIPSIISLVVPLAVLSFMLKGEVKSPEVATDNEDNTTSFEKQLVFFMGVGGLIFVPIFKIATHLPPFMGMMLSLGVLWAATELLNKNKKDKFKEKLSPSHALERIDTPSMLFFLGILLAVGALQVSGILPSLATWLDQAIPNRSAVVVSIGLLSSIVDNVPLVAGAIEMYPQSQYPELGVDAHFWQFLAYCAGTGGSVLIIGSAAGVAVMGIEKVEFFWYLKKISWLALIGYFAGVGAYLAMQAMGLMLEGAHVAATSGVVPH